MATLETTLSMPEALSLLGKNAIVTGGARGIGARIAIEFARRGANVALGYHSSTSKEKAEAVAEAVRKFGRKATTIQAELDGTNVGEDIVQHALNGLGTKTIDILVNNAAVDHKPGHCTEFDIELFDRIMHVNVRAPMLLVKAMEAYWPQRGGRIISISSIQARHPTANMALYSSSKAALECLSKYWAAEMGKQYLLTSNVIEVGAVETDYFKEAPEEVKEMLREVPSAERRLGQVDDVAQIAAFLASDSARWINGDSIGGNGGTIYL